MVKKLVLLVFLLGQLTGQAFAEGIVVTLNSEATINSAMITLGDVANITGTETERVKQLSEIKLGSAPLPGNKLVLATQTVSARLAAAGLDLSDVEWHIPATVTIFSAGQTVSGDMLLQAALSTLKKELKISETKDNSGEISLMPLSESQALIVPLGQIECKGEIPYGIRYNVPTQVVVRVYTGGVYFTNAMLKFDIKAYKNVLVANSNLEAFQVLTTENVRFERRDIGRMTGYITDISKVVGLMTHRAITAGMPLNESMLSKPPVVQRGSSVTIIVKSGDSVITACGMALQQGAEGEIIRVQNLNSKKVLNARVVDENTVEILMYSGR
ncbi:MAG: flagella basal body P-ring formation protein FlgA [Firmicutes bacterium]|nr:flagella basal body P-ring formation protein FlgA [Bacillota bacterium]